MSKKKFSSAKGYLCLFGICFLISCILIFAAGSKVSDNTKLKVEAFSNKAITVAVSKSSRENLSKTLAISAEFRPYQEVEVHAKVAGYVKTIYVDVGDRVSSGQLLASLEIPEFKDDLEQAAASNKRFEEEVKRANSELERAKAAHEEAHLTYTRLLAVNEAKPNLVAQQEIDQATGRDRIAEAQISTAKAALSVAEQQLEVSKASEGKVKTLNTYSQITAPFSGVVTKRFADTGSMIQAGTASNTQAMPLVRISEISRLRLILPVPESIVPKIHIGASVEVKVQSLGKSFQGTISRFANKIDSSTRTMETEVDVANHDFVLTPGMYASAVLTIDQKNNVVTAPLQAIANLENKPTVLIVNQEKNIEERPVTLGMETDTKVEVLSGLSEGEMVVIGNRSQYKPGQKVEPKLIEMESVGGSQ